MYWLGRLTSVRDSTRLRHNVKNNRGNDVGTGDDRMKTIELVGCLRLYFSHSIVLKNYRLLL